MSQRIISVGTFVHYLKGKLESDPLTQGVLIEGEISNFSSYRSGHWYFSLKDQDSQIRCVMFAFNNRKLDFIPKDGDKVIVKADASVYEGRGDLQLLVTNMKPSGIGDLYLQFEALKKKLSGLGLFNQDHKKAIPSYPMKIGLVTGKNTAARSDVLTTLKRRWPLATVYECNALVQGTESANQVVDALKTLDELSLDVILLVRGGGSIEDLFSFNDETMAYTIYNMKTPIITGIGHEVDFTIADFVADLRAPTPTGAAELATPDIISLKVDLEKKKERMKKATVATYNVALTRLNTVKRSKIMLQPETLVIQKNLKLMYLQKEFGHHISIRNTNLANELNMLNTKLLGLTNAHITKQHSRLDNLGTMIEMNTNKKLDIYKNQMKNYLSLLDAYSPLKVLERGYSIVAKEQQVLTDVKQVKKGDQIQIQLNQGKLEAEIIEIIDGGTYGRDKKDI